MSGRTQIPHLQTLQSDWRICAAVLAMVASCSRSGFEPARQHGFSSDNDIGTDSGGAGGETGPLGDSMTDGARGDTLFGDRANSGDTIDPGDTHTPGDTYAGDTHTPGDTVTPGDSYAAGDTDTGALASPTGVVLDNCSGGLCCQNEGVGIRWDPVPGATYYEVRWLCGGGADQSQQLLLTDYDDALDFPVGIGQTCGSPTSAYEVCACDASSCLCEPIPFPYPNLCGGICCFW